MKDTMNSKNQTVSISNLSEETQFHDLITNVIQLIENAKTRVTIQTNSVMVALYWNIGNTINKRVLENKRADYGEQIIAKWQSG